MAYYAVEYTFTADRRHLQVRPTHREYLADLAERGSIALCGPLVSDTGGLLIFRAGSEAEVRELVDDDPYMREGVLDGVRVEEWDPVIGSLIGHLDG